MSVAVNDRYPSPLRYPGDEANGGHFEALRDKLRRWALSSDGH